MVKKTITEEEKENDKGNDGNSGGDSSTPSGEQGGEQGSRAPIESSGGEQGGKQGQQGREQGSSGGEQGSGGGEQGSSRAGEKFDLLQRIRAQRANGQRNTGSATDGTSDEHSQADGGGLPKSQRGAKTDNGITPRADSGDRPSSKQGDDGGGGSSENPQGNDRDRRVKPQGVNVKASDKIKQLAKAASETSAPKLRFTWDDKPLSNKEGDEMLPKIRGLLEFIFRHMDKGLSISNRNRAEAHVWSSIDDEDLDIIAGHLVEMGKASKVVATAVRRMTNSYRLLQIGLITLPKFIQTYQFYAANGGFSLLAAKQGTR